MALPPEPLSELVEQADAIVVGRVVELIALGKKVAPPATAKTLGPRASGVGYQAATQKVRIQVERVLKGTAAAELVVDKPEAPYTLRVGDSGAFFLKGKDILGRYGPDTHAVAKVEKAL